VSALVMDGQGFHLHLGVALSKLK